MKKKALKTSITFVATVLDNSSSMSKLINKVKPVVNMIHTSVQRNSLQSKMPASVSMYTFDDIVRTQFENTPSEEVPSFDRYSPSGMTALFAGLKHAIDRLEAFGTLVKGDKAFLVNVITDGEENASQVNIPFLVGLMKELMINGDWTFTFQVPVGKAAAFSRCYNIPMGNIREWEQTNEGTQTVADSMDVGLTSYFSDRSLGKKATQDFYQTDASKLTDTKVNRALDDVTKQFRVMAVPAEAAIKDFVESKTKKPYVIGSSYYELTKTEKVQANKKVLLMKIGEKTVYGGPGARSLIGIPEGVAVKVVPGNHSAYKIYVESTSVNRKLVRGTKVLLDKLKILNSKSTWDHNAATNDKLAKAGPVKV